MRDIYKYKIGKMTSVIKNIFFVMIIQTILVYSSALEEAKNYKMQCDNNDSLACMALADMYYDGAMIKEIVKEYRIKAEKYYKKSCTGEILKSCYKLSQIYFNQGNLHKSFDIVQDICNKGFKKGCSTLAHYYHLGYGTKKNPPLALKIYEKTCNNGEAQSCLSAGYFYLNNNVSKAIHLFQKACLGKNGLACYKLGNFYFNGKYIDKNITKSLKYYNKSCFEGLYSPACSKSVDIELGRK